MTNIWLSLVKSWPFSIERWINSDFNSIIHFRFWCGSQIWLPVNYWKANWNQFLVDLDHFGLIWSFHWRLWTTKTNPSSNICCLFSFWSISRLAIDALRMELKSPTKFENFERRSVSIFLDFTKKIYFSYQGGASRDFNVGWSQPMRITSKFEDLNFKVWNHKHKQIG